MRLNNRDQLLSFFYRLCETKKVHITGMPAYLSPAFLPIYFSLLFRQIVLIGYYPLSCFTF
jgi:hypothetical protein